MTSTPCGEVAGHPRDEDPAHAGRFEAFVVDLLGEDPPVGSIAHRVECRQGGGAVVGLVEANPDNDG